MSTMHEIETQLTQLRAQRDALYEQRRQILGADAVAEVVALIDALRAALVTHGLLSKSTDEAYQVLVRGYRDLCYRTSAAVYSAADGPIMGVER